LLALGACLLSEASFSWVSSPLWNFGIWKYSRMCVE
jgi:hypothetical protein